MLVSRFVNNSDMDDTTTQLLTLLNVSALKRKRPAIEPLESPKLNKRKQTVRVIEPRTPPAAALEQNEGQTAHDDDLDEIHSDSPEDETQIEGELHSSVCIRWN